MNDKRLSTLRIFLSENGSDAFLLTNYYNILYLTGIKTLSPHEREAFIFITARNAYVFTDGRYTGEVHVPPPYRLRELSHEKNLTRHLQEICAGEGIKKIAFEREDLTWGEHELLRKNLTAALIPVDRVIIRMRCIKEPHEIELIKKACRIGDDCLRAVVPALRIGMTEKQIAWELEIWLRKRGHRFSFDPIIAVDRHSALPHYRTGEGKLKKGSVLLIDMGVQYKDYCSDITRMFFFGAPAPRLRGAYETLQAVQQETISRLGQVGKLSEADGFCRSRLQESGYATYPHSTGHGIGLEVHEYPKMATASTDVKSYGNVLTVEPGIYRPGEWGMRVEDTVYIDGNGKAIPLTLFPKRIRVL